MDRLKGKVAVITGATSGIGLKTAELFAAEGAFVVLSARRVDEGKAIERRLGANTMFVRTDVLIEEEIANLIQSSVERFGKIDAFFCNAGSGGVLQKISEIDETEFDRSVDILLKNVFFCSQIAARQMIEQGDGGNIVNISSQAGVVGAPDRGPYSGANGGVNNLTKTMAAEWAEHRIRVNAVAPTVTRSPLAEAAMAASPAFADAVKTKNLLRGALAEPEEMSAPVIFLASEAASMITGHTLVVDGGWTIL